MAHPDVIKALQGVDPGDIMSIPGPFNTKTEEDGQLDVAILKKRGDEKNPMLDVQVSMFGIWLCDATIKVQKDRCLVHVTKDTRDA